MHATTLLVGFASCMMGIGHCCHAIRPILLQCYDCTYLRCVELIVTVLRTAVTLRVKFYCYVIVLISDV